MTERQRIALMADHWPAACRAQGWKVSDRALRIEVFSRILGRALSSASEINDREDYDAIKRELGTLADKLPAAMDTSAKGEARRLRALIRGELLPCIALYTGGADGAARYLAEVLNDKFNRGRSVEVRDLDELTAKPRFRQVRGELVEYPSELKQLLMTLAARLNGKTGLRNRAGDTVREMRVKAGLVPGVVPPAPAPEREPTVEQDWTFVEEPF